jgi:hypothetical protein
MTPRIRTSLQNAPSGPLTKAETEELRIKAWREQGIPILPLEEVMDDWLKQAIINWCNAKYGKRKASK